MAKQRQTKMQYQVGTLAAIPQLEDRTDEQLLSESKHRAAARAILGARAAERYDAKQARAYFNEALAGASPRERPQLRQLMKASLAQAERRPDELKEAMEKLGQAPPSGRQLFVLRLMGLISPPEGASALLRVRGFLLLLVLIVVLLGIGTGVAELISIPAGGWPIYSSVLIGFLIVAATLGILALVGRRRQRKAREEAKAQRAAAPRR